MAPAVQETTEHVLTAPAHALTWSQVADELRADTDDGLTTEEAKRRLGIHGNNELGNDAGVNPVKILVRQIANAMTLVLILAMAVSFGIGSYIEGGVIAGVIVLNVVIGFFQEFQAAKTMNSLKSLSSPTATAVRDGQSMSVPTKEIVPGDLVEMKTGDTIPADVRLFEAINFETDEALLTGESLPVTKTADQVLDSNLGAGDRTNVAFSSSTVTKGRASGICFATGMNTEIGTIAANLRKKDSKFRAVKKNPDGATGPHRYMQAVVLTLYDAVGNFLGVNVGTPLQRKLSQLAVLLFFVAVVCAIIVLGANNFQGDREVIVYAVATALSMIPASLVVILTITMAAGTQRMAEKRVIVRNLRSLEALGSVTDICSDKTGTLTQGKMLAQSAWIPSKGTYTIGETDEAFNPTKGAISYHPEAPKDLAGNERGQPATYSELVRDNKAFRDYLSVASLANLAHVHQNAEGEWLARGDPTEVAIQVFACRFQGWDRRTSVEGRTAGKAPDYKMLMEFPFDSSIKKMSVLYRGLHDEKKYVFTKGAVEQVLRSCTSWVSESNAEPIALDDDFASQVMGNVEGLTKLGLRVLALASRPYEEEYREGEEIDRNAIESNLVFRGLIGLYDPPRPESAASVRQCHEAGIEVHMLTGDHPGTAAAIASQIGILPEKRKHVSKDKEDAMVMTASQFDALTDDEVDALPILPLVIARCTPTTKVRMIEALHRRDRFCAMTGDGVNDSPSLKRADVGIAMGMTGSDVAKDASDIILTDDNFASILAAIEEGRRTFDNIQKFVLHLLAQNVALALTLLVGLAFKDRDNLSVFPISPVEILWVIMVTSAIPDMGLGFEVAVPGILRRPPQSLKQGIFTWELLIDMVVYGVWMGALCLAAFVLVLYGFSYGIGDARGCNDSIDGGCVEEFRARATAFAFLTWSSLVLAWECLDPRRSFFRMQPGSIKYLTQWMHDIWRNKFLFYSIMAGFVTIFPILYIPTLNTTVFKHDGISWEWSIVLIETLLFFMGVEFYKWVKRRTLRSRAEKEKRENASQTLAFSSYSTQTTQSSDVEKA